MLDSPNKSARVRFRQIADSDVNDVVQPIARGFAPRRRRLFWQDAMARLAARATPPGAPRYGYMLDDGPRGGRRHSRGVVDDAGGRWRAGAAAGANIRNALATNVETSDIESGGASRTDKIKLPVVTPRESGASSKRRHRQF